MHVGLSWQALIKGFELSNFEVRDPQPSTLNLIGALGTKANSKPKPKALAPKHLGVTGRGAVQRRFLSGCEGWKLCLHGVVLVLYFATAAKTF